MYVYLLKQVNLKLEFDPDRVELSEKKKNEKEKINK